jgi:hypothetical protein
METAQGIEKTAQRPALRVEGNDGGIVPVFENLRDKRTQDVPRADFDENWPPDLCMASISTNSTGESMWPSRSRRMDSDRVHKAGHGN